MLQAEQVLQNRYQLKQKLGQNAGHQTWLAEDQGTQPAEPVVVKLLAFIDQVHWDNLRLFEREAQVLKQLNHPQIPKYRDYFSIDDRILWFGLVQEYVPGASLKELLSQGKRFTESGIRQIATEILQILVYLHELNPPVLHRDIKPSNLILSEENRIYLVDFGAVQDRASKEGATFTVVGTYGYAPMEQFGGRAVASSDLYALGATLVHLLTGIPPADLPQRDLRIQFGDRLSLNPNLLHWIETLLEPDVTRRFSTARQALDTLQSGLLINPNIRQEDGIQTTTSTSTLKIQPPEGSHVEISKSSDELLIQVPGLAREEIRKLSQQSRVKWLCLVGLYLLDLLLLIALATSSNPGLFIVLAVSMMLIATSLLLPFLQIERAVLFQRSISASVCFKRDLFLVRYSRFDSTVNSHDGITSSIVDILQDKNQEYNTTSVTIVTPRQEYSFHHMALSRADCIWLVQEIKDWLGLK